MIDLEDYDELPFSEANLKAAIKACGEASLEGEHLEIMLEGELDNYFFTAHGNQVIVATAPKYGERCTECDGRAMLGGVCVCNNTGLAAG